MQVFIIYHTFYKMRLRWEVELKNERILIVFCTILSSKITCIAPQKNWWRHKKLNLQWISNTYKINSYTSRDLWRGIVIPQIFKLVIVSLIKLRNSANSWHFQFWLCDLMRHHNNKVDSWWLIDYRLSVAFKLKQNKSLISFYNIPLF